MPLLALNGRKRVAIEEVCPQIEAARHPSCRDAGNQVVVIAATGGRRFTFRSGRVKA